MLTLLTIIEDNYENVNRAVSFCKLLRMKYYHKLPD